MARSSKKQPTEVELDILSILWRQKSASAREVHESLLKLRETNYSTTVKMLAVMSTKGLVIRNENQRPILFSAAQPKRKTQTGMLNNLIRKAYDGSVGAVVMQALSSKRASNEELQQIRELLDKLSSDRET